ncbi:MAG: protein kinase, partial [Gemmataceae bacterium]|nr:protein kinase [Gemmataceae bacterium]
MQPTTVLPADAPRSPSPPSEADGPPTCLVPTGPNGAPPPTAVAVDLEMTPAPRRTIRPLTVPPSLGAMAFSGSLWGSDWGGDAAPAGARRLPQVGDTVQGFKLVGELGRGAFARVYRAEQQGLAGRAVALKVTIRPTREAEHLARLQHTNVVPVYSVHTDAGVQMICMPFLGRVTFADLLKAHRATGSSAARGRKTTRAARTTAAGSKA